MGNLNPKGEYSGSSDFHPSGAAPARSGERVIPFGKYLLLDRIAVGGMAEVFTAKSFGVEGFEKIIAIKRILPTMAEEEEFISMFIDEAKIAGQLTHANIVPIYELGKIGQSHYIAMEYVWGKDLLQIMNRFRKMRRYMPPVMAAWIASKICEALDFAHRKRDRAGRPLDIVHRDVSPQNCLVSYEGQVKMIDFGIAKAAMRHTKTQAGVLKGKFGYMSPEQVAGLGVDHRSDVFAVGTCMHEMLTSERLFVGESDFSTLEKVRNAEVAPPSLIAPNIPPELEAIVLRALAREPSHRFQNAGEMHEALQMFVAREKPPFGTSKLASWMRTAFATELTKEKARLDALAKVRKPPSMPPAPPSVAFSSGDSALSSGAEELPEESTTISASPFENSERSPFAGVDSKTADDMYGDATQIFFSADENLAEDQDEEEPTTAMVGNIRSANQETASLSANPGTDARTQARVAPHPPASPPKPPAPSRAPSTAPPPSISRPAGMPAPPVLPPFVPPPATSVPPTATPPAPPSAARFPDAPPQGEGQNTVVKAPDVGLRARVAAQDTVEILPAARKRKTRRWLGAGLAVAGLAAMSVVVGLVIFLGRSSGGTIEIRITPADAVTTVLIDGTPRGQAPLRVENVAAGAHLIEVQAPGFQSVTQTVPVTDGAMAMLVIPLIPVVAGVPVPQPPPTPAPTVLTPSVPTPTVPAPTVPAPTVPAPPAAVPVATAVTAPSTEDPTSSTPSADLQSSASPTTTEREGSVVRVTPTATETREERASARSPRVRRPPRAPTRAPASRAATPTARPEAESRGRGYLMIQTLPWARVFIDGRDTGQNTPVRQMAVPAGSHRIGLRTSDGQMHTYTVDVPAGQTVRVIRQL